MLKQGLQALGQRSMDANVTVRLPHIAAVILACAAGAAQVLNETLIGVTGMWHAYIGLGLVIAAYLGVKPLVGAGFRAAVHAPAWVAQTLTAIVGVATIVVGQLTGAPGWVQPTLAAAVTVLVALGFGPAGSQIVAASDARRVKAAAKAAS